MNKKYSYLIKNILVFSISSFSTKLLGFLLVPLYTNTLTTKEYGSIDFINTTINLLIPILTIEIVSAVLVFALENDEKKEEVLTVSLKQVVISCIILSILLVFNHIFKLVKILDEYAIYVFIMFFSQAILPIEFELVRALDKMTCIALTSFIGSVSLVVSNFIFLVICNLGIEGFFASNILSNMVQILFLFLYVKMWRFVNISRYSKKRRNIVWKRMVNYSFPLVFNSIGWWVNSASDKYIVTWFCGISENGIYSVASKIPSILNLIQNIFSQAWGVSAIKEYNEDHSSDFFSKIYNTYNLVCVLVCSFIIAVDKILARILYANDFYGAWKYVPFLLIAAVFAAMSSLIGGIFAAMKNSKIFAKTTVISAIVNLFLNFIFIPIIGTIGAAISTAISYFLAWLMRYIALVKRMEIHVFIFRDLVAYLTLTLQSLFILVVHTSVILQVMVHIVFIAFIFILFFSEINILKNFLIHAIKSKEGKTND